MQSVDELPPITVAEQEAAPALKSRFEPEPPRPRVNQKLIDGLRDLADFIESSIFDDLQYTNHTFHVFCKDKAELREKVRDIPAPLQKEVNESYYYVRKKFGPNLDVAWVLEREVACERVKVGEKTVPATPEIVVPEKVIPAQPERVEEVFDWVCPKSILADEPEAVTA